MLNKFLMNGIKEEKNPDASIWRYMSLSKFLQLLQGKALYLARADQFEDPFEGTKSYQDIKAEKESILNIEGVDKDAVEVLFSDRINKWTRDSLQKQAYISCWYRNESESEAMWKLYGLNNEGIAIRTTYAKLKDVATNCEQTNMAIGKVEYVSYQSETVAETVAKNDSLCLPFFFKRMSFVHECEVRVVAMHFKEGMDFENPVGIFVPFNLNEFIEEVYISPLATKWFYTVVKDVCNKYGLDDKKIKWSRQLIDPISEISII